MGWDYGMGLWEDRKMASRIPNDLFCDIGLEKRKTRMGYIQRSEY
jgi:hypothetical protein